MRIGELAKATGCQTVTIRFYERKGLLDSKDRSESNYRQYGPLDVERLSFIRNCRALGLSLRTITRLIAIQDDPSMKCDEVNAYLDEQLSEVRRQKQSLECLENDLLELRQRCLNPGTSSSCGVLCELTHRH